MTTEQAFLASIAENVEDDAPRLIYADWLEERGQHERAEFIRVQCELAKRGCADQCDALRHRELVLFDDDARTLRWFGLPQPWARIARLEPFTENTADYPYVIVRRGFIFSITLPCAVFLEHAGAIIEAVPMLRDVRLSDIIGTLSRATAIGPRNRQQRVAYVWGVDWVDLAHHIIDLEGWAEHIEGVFRFVQHMRYATELASFDTVEEAWQAITYGCLAYARDQLARYQSERPAVAPR